MGYLERKALINNLKDNIIVRMGQIRILAGGSSQQAISQAKGKLFEKLMAGVLRNLGYEIAAIPNVNHAGMEIDIEGRHKATGIPLYAECKCSDTVIDTPKLQAFFGKYMSRWLNDNRSHGIFIALPSVNSHAKGFYNDSIETHQNITFLLYEQEYIMESILDSNSIISPDNVSRKIDRNMGKAGDWLLLYTDKGFFWIQYVISQGSGVVDKIGIFDGNGDLITDVLTHDYLTSLYPELSEFEKVTLDIPVNPSPKIEQDLEQIVEVQGSSECFEYQFPAAPQYFVGRLGSIEHLKQYVNDVINKQTSSRGLLFEANSGWGKSSLVLTSVAKLGEDGHFAIAIDSRSASSAQFVLRVVDYTLSKFGNFENQVSDHDLTLGITGFEGAARLLIKIGNSLERNKKILLIFFDQFENVFFLPEALRRIRDLFLKICDAQSNVVLGFSWKTDLIGLTNEFPYKLRDTIVDSSELLFLEPFSEVEANALLDKLSNELHTSLRKDLRFFLSEFSQGYPWLLKKLCAHVKSQRMAGVSQSDIARTLLNVEELFKEDIRGLTAEEEEVLRQIAKSAPISVSELGEKFNPELVLSLVHRRLVVRIANKYDIYWDIFRDYLNFGNLPIQENYILRAQVGSVIKAIEYLRTHNNTLDINSFQTMSELSEGSFYNVARDMGLLGLANLKDGNATLLIKLPTVEVDRAVALREYLARTLRRNRLVSKISTMLEEKGDLHLDEISGILRESCPYIAATDDTWIAYARIFATWIDFAHIGFWDSREKILTQHESGRDIRESILILPKRKGAVTPRIQYKPIEEILIKIVTAAKGDGFVDWTGFARSTLFKALGTLEDLRFIVRKHKKIQLTKEGIDFVDNPDMRQEFFGNGAKNIVMFSVFLKLLEIYKDEGISHSELASKLNEEMGQKWKQGTAELNIKIMLNWVKHTQFAYLVNEWKQNQKRKNPDQLRLV